MATVLRDVGRGGERVMDTGPWYEQLIFFSCVVAMIFPIALFLVTAFAALIFDIDIWERDK